MIIKCNSCGTEYVLTHFKLPFKDKGETLYCKCGQSVFSYDKGTDSYSIEEVSIYKERMRRIEEEKRVIQFVIVENVWYQEPGHMVIFLDVLIIQKVATKQLRGKHTFVYCGAFF